MGHMHYRSTVARGMITGLGIGQTESTCRSCQQKNKGRVLHQVMGKAPFHSEILQLDQRGGIPHVKRETLRLSPGVEFWERVVYG